MVSQQTGSFGSWISPITADAAVAETGSLSEPRIDGDNIYWIEGRPLEKGRNVVVARAADGTIRDITPSPFNVRSQVYSYGGGAYAVSNNVVYFVNFGDNQIYQQVAGNAPTKITSSAKSLFADICVDAARNRLIAIREEHPNGDVIKAIHTLVAIDIATGREATLDSGCDFYSSPTLNVDGSRLAWLSWQHPNMPWTSTYLNVSRSRSGGHADRQTDRPRRFRIVISTPMVARREALLHFRPHGFLEPIPLERLRRGAGPSSRRGIRGPSVATRSFNLRVYVTRHSDLLVCPKRYMAPGLVRNTDTDRSRLSDGIFLLVGCACVGNNRSAALCHNDLAAGNRDRRCEHGSGFADQAFGSIRQLAKIPKLLFDAATDRISD